MSNLFSSTMSVLVTLKLSFCFIIEEGKNNFLYMFFSKCLVKQFTVVLSFTSIRKHVSVICNTSQWNIV